MRLVSTLLTGLVLAGSADIVAAAPLEAFKRVDCSTMALDQLVNQTGVECGWVEVPESRGSSSSRRVKLPVVVARALGNRKADPVVYIHGGPGIATLDNVPRALAGKKWPLLRASHDLVFFDMRGTGRAIPRICPAFDDGVQKLELQPLSASAELEAVIALARDCRRALGRSGFAFGAYNAVAVAEDMEAIRRALGVEKWNIAATSYGTLPALESLRRFPGGVRALLIDSAFPAHSQYWAEQMSVTANSLAALQRRCNASPECKSSYPDIRALAASAIAGLDAKPLAIGERQIDGGDFADALWTGLVGTETVRYVPALLLRAAARDEAVIAAYVGAFGGDGTFGSYSPSQSLMVNCHEVFTPKTKTLVARAIRQNPDLAGERIADEQDRLCAEMQPTRAAIEFFTPVESDAPVLIFAGEFDPATPPIDAHVTARFLKNATIVEVDGASHAPFNSDDCTRSIGVAFLDNPRREPDATCMASRGAPKIADRAEFDGFLASLK